MTEFINKMAEERFGIKVDLSDAQKLHSYINDKYGGAHPENIKKVFVSGEAATFLTVNETYFFREPLHFEFLTYLLPSFEETGINICSAATSIGCEAYSIAMLIESYNRGRANPIPYHIDAFDINKNAIDAAAAGIYNERSMRDDGSNFHYTAKPWLSRHEGGWRVDTALGAHINFFVHNLMDALPREKYHIIFFRNAFIYFSGAARDRLLSNLSGALKDKGILITGVSETAGVRHENLDSMDRGEVFYFQKRYLQESMNIV